MQMFKKIAALLCLICCLSSIPVTAFAVSENENAVIDVSGENQIKMAYINDMDAQLYISNGTASVYAFVRGHKSLATQSEITVKLQVKSGLIWQTVATWSDSQAGHRASVNRLYGVTSGKKYRLVATGTVWNGSNSETRTITTSSVNS